MTAMDIMREVAAEHGLTVGEIQKGRYKRNICRAVRDAVNRLRANGYSTGKIAQMTGRDPSTVETYIYYQLSPKERAEKPALMNIRVRNVYAPKLRRYAEMTGASVSAVVNQAISDMLESA